MYCMAVSEEKGAYKYVRKQYYHYVRSDTSWMGQLFGKKLAREAIESFLSVASVSNFLLERGLFNRHKKALFAFTMQRASFSYDHGKHAGLWRLFAMLLKQMATVWWRSPQTPLLMLYGKWKKGFWPVA